VFSSSTWDSCSIKYHYDNINPQVYSKTRPFQVKGIKGLISRNSSKPIYSSWSTQKVTHRKRNIMLSIHSMKFHTKCSKATSPFGRFQHLRIWHRFALLTRMALRLNDLTQLTTKTPTLIRQFSLYAKKKKKDTKFFSSVNWFFELSSESSTRKPFRPVFTRKGAQIHWCVVVGVCECCVKNFLVPSKLAGKFAY
jgi:hypothetical protein